METPLAIARVATIPVVKSQRTARDIIMICYAALACVLLISLSAAKADETVFAWGSNSRFQSAVPADLTDVVAIAGGFEHSLVLKADGTVIAWGSNTHGQSTVPPNLTGVVAIAAGHRHSLALKGDGTVVAWGSNTRDQSKVPVGLTDVVAIAGGHEHSIALKADGTVVTWGITVTIIEREALTDAEKAFQPNLTNVVAIDAHWFGNLALMADGNVVAWNHGSLGSLMNLNLTGVVAVAAGSGHSLALRGDGSVIAWGQTNYGQSTVPENLTDVIAIAAGDAHSLALKADGTVVAWGNTNYGLNLVPANLPRVFAIAAGSAHNLALVHPAPESPGKPTIVLHPQNRTRSAGQLTTFRVTAIGIAPLSYQWRKNGINIPGANSATLTLNSVTAADSGCYSVVVWNSLGSVESQSACLAVLTDGAITNKPAQIVMAPAPTKPVGIDSLVVVTHGYQAEAENADVSWVNEMAAAIQQKSPANWFAYPFVWKDKASGTPSLALISAWIQGTGFGQSIAQQNWARVHLIGHSAGARFVESVAKQIQAASSNTIVHCTFLDPYHSTLLLGADDNYGTHADWADCYFTQDLTGGGTAGREPYAYNVDVDWLDPNHDTLLFRGSLLAFSTHGFPHDFYFETVTNTNPGWCAANYGFALSAEANGQSRWANHPIGNTANPVVLCGPANALPVNTLPFTVIGITIGEVAHAVSAATSALVSGAGFVLNSIWSVLPVEDSERNGPSSSKTSTNIPAWLAIAVTVTSSVNFVQFEAGFTSTNAADGLLTIYWNTNAIGTVDERVVSPGLQLYRFTLPGTVTGGLYTLSFRLDSFNNTPSSLAVTNVASGFVGVTQPAALMISTVSNAAPILQLMGPSNFTYVIQASTNLVDWKATALLLNTNGAVSFHDPSWSNAPSKFYRAIGP